MGDERKTSTRHALARHASRERCLWYFSPLPLLLCLSSSYILAKMSLNTNRSSVKSTTQGKQFLMPNEKQCSKLNEKPAKWEDAKKARILVLKTVGGKNDIKTIKHSVGKFLREQEGCRVTHVYSYLFVDCLATKFPVFFACVALRTKEQVTKEAVRVDSIAAWGRNQRQAH